MIRSGLEISTHVDGSPPQSIDDGQGFRSILELPTNQPLKAGAVAIACVQGIEQGASLPSFPRCRHSRAGGNPANGKSGLHHSINNRRAQVSFLFGHRSLPSPWIPACAGMTFQ